MASTRQQFLAEAEQLEKDARRMLSRAAELRLAALGEPADISPFVCETSQMGKAIPGWLDGMLFHIDTGSGLSDLAYQLRDVSYKPCQGRPECL